MTEREKEVSGEDLLALEQSKKNVNFSFTLNPLIQQYINYYQGPRGRSTMENGLRRSGQYMKVVRQIFAQEGVPLDVATEAMRLASQKLSIPTKLVRREFEGM